MTCNGCLNLVGKQCKFGKQDLLGALRDESGEVIQLQSPCVLRNTQHNLDYDMAHLFALASIAIAAFYIIDNESDIDRLFEILDKEKEYGEKSPIGQFNVLVSPKVKLSLREINIYSKRMAEYNKKRLWNFRVLVEGTPTEYILKHCDFPFVLQITSEADFAVAQNFKYKCFSGQVPEKLGNIMSMDYLLKQVEKLNAEIQA